MYISNFSVICRYLNNTVGIHFPPDQMWHCTIAMTVVNISLTCSNLLLVSMTFDRFYSIIMPHKAASFNTVNRSKKTMICIVIFSTFYNIPHMFLTFTVGSSCIPFGKGMVSTQGQFYYWLSLIVNFIFPFISLLIMNSVIIHTLRTRSLIVLKDQGQGRSEGQSSKLKNSEKQIYITLLLVTFGFLILSTPSYVFYFYRIVYDYKQSPLTYAVFYLYFQCAAKLHYTNAGVNFFLYVMSGQKFRRDLVRLITCRRDKQNTLQPSVSTEMHTVSSVS